ncbi:hypothetical protein A2U01_0031135, partial [Trifolium medium]|nr:hypothetical protein [Trifolium medium]
MEGDEVRPSPLRVNPPPDLSWVADEPRETTSMFVGCESSGHKNLFLDVQDPPIEDWELSSVLGIRCPSPILRCGLSSPPYNPITASPEFVGVFAGVREDSRAFTRVPTLRLFFHAFGLQHSCPKGEKARGKAVKGEENESGKYGWVFFKQRTSLFKMFEDSIRGFKEKYYGVRPITTTGWKSIIYRGPKKDGAGQVVIGPHGAPVEEDYAKFSFKWIKDHYLLE